MEAGCSSADSRDSVFRERPISLAAVAILAIPRFCSTLRKATETGSRVSRRAGNIMMAVRANPTLAIFSAAYSS